MMYKALFCFLLILLIPNIRCRAQLKFEYEKRISLNNIPESALNFIDQFPFTKKIKWYKEVSQDGISIEAKTYYNRHKYSIEFTEDGQIIDIEKRVQFTTLNNTIKARITEELSKIFDKYYIKKTQVQYTNFDLDTSLIFSDNDTGQKSNYELVIKGKKEGIYNTYEVTFSHNGTLLKNLIVSQRTSDNIEF